MKRNRERGSLLNSTSFFKNGCTKLPKLSVNRSNTKKTMNVVLLITASALFGISMKIADLLNEHGLKLFKGSNILFGVLWGLFGVMLLKVSDNIANMILAMVLAFILRMRIDYRNHAIATSIIICYFLSYCNFISTTFYYFFLIFVIFGSIKDILDDYLKSKSILKNFFETGWYYPIASLLHSVYCKNYEGFIVLTSYILFYDLIKYYFEEKLYGREV